MIGRDAGDPSSQRTASLPRMLRVSAIKEGTQAEILQSDLDSDSRESLGQTLD